ncbi:MAG: hypothetical protein IT477_10570 [Rhodanobacteraceae bacterium]|nr:hypothetical protein [Rhodanobacteraceae bacterium]
MDSAANTHSRPLHEATQRYVDAFKRGDKILSRRLANALSPEAKYDTLKERFGPETRLKIEIERITPDPQPHLVSWPLDQVPTYRLMIKRVVEVWDGRATSFRWVAVRERKDVNRGTFFFEHDAEREAQWRLLQEQALRTQAPTAKHRLSTIHDLLLRAEEEMAAVMNPRTPGSDDYHADFKLRLMRLINQARLEADIR